MKKYSLFIIFFVLGFIANAQGIQFRDISYESALEQANTENKYVFIDFYTQWCGPCRMMSEQIFPMTEIGNYFNPKFVSIKIDAEKGEGIEIAKKYGIKAYPTFVILDSNGKLLHIFAGGILNLTFIDKVEESFQKDKAFGVLQEAYNTGSLDKRGTANYLLALSKTFTTRVDTQIEDFYNGLDNNEKFYPECLYIFDDYTKVGSNRYKFLVDNMNKFVEVNGKQVIDSLFKKKHIANFYNIISGYGNISEEELSQYESFLKGLKIKDDTIIPLYIKACRAKLFNGNIDELYTNIIEICPKAPDSDMNLFLYAVLPPFKTKFSQDQWTAIYRLITNDSVRSHIRI